ncbi:MAG: hypothetical protein B6D34_07545 [Candidatus Brocadia sp. UTAMX1]|nr:MAG: hypothetical protein B6D34_07545 [Candidatus Brocadia sp. UTAMX1]
MNPKSCFIYYGAFGLVIKKELFMIIKKNLKKNANLELSKNLLEKAGIEGKITILVGKNEIVIRRIPEETGIIEEMVGLGKNVFTKDSVTLQRELRAEWKR